MIEPRDIDLNLLVIFQEVFQERQISSVARRLGLSQPAVSNALARLRRTFADELFVRTAHGMQPTPFAEQMAEPVNSALAHVAKALNRLDVFSPADSQRRFTIAMTDVGEVYFMPRLVEQCRQQAPGVVISTVRAGAIDLKTEMEAGRSTLPSAPSTMFPTPCISAACFAKTTSACSAAAPAGSQRRRSLAQGISGGATSGSGLAGKSV